MSVYDNLTVDDIVRTWSEVQLDQAIRGVARNTDSLAIHCRLMVENELKRPFVQVMASQ